MGEPSAQGMLLDEMTAPGFAVFDTPIGRCGIAWSAQGVLDIELPAAREQATRARLQRACPAAREAAPPAEIEQAIQSIAAVLGGQSRDLSSVRLDMRGIADFDRQVYALARAIPAGATRTYGELAKQLGGENRALAREVGQALGKNPFPIVVPCHRVVAANGRPGGFSAPGGRRTKLRLLALEHTSPNGTLPLFRD